MNKKTNANSRRNPAQRWNDPNEWVEEVMDDSRWMNHVYRMIFVNLPYRPTYYKTGLAAVSFEMDFPKGTNWRRSDKTWMVEFRSNLYHYAVHPQGWHMIIDDFLVTYRGANQHFYMIHEPYLYNSKTE